MLVKPGADFTEDWTVTADQLGDWNPLPVSGKLLVNITKLVSITKDGVTEVEKLPLSSFDGLNLSLTKKVNGNDEPVTIKSTSYPYLVPEDGQGISADTSLTLTVTPEASMQLTGGTVTSTLRNGSFTVALQSWGKATVTATGSSAAPCVVILFDSQGNAVSSGTTSGGVFTSDPLPAGDYTAVAYETNDYFGAVGSKAALSTLGLTTRDYAEGSVAIANGGTAKLPLTVPKLNNTNLTSILVTDQCSLAFRSSRAVTGETFDMQVNYALQSNSTAQTITLALPSGISIVSNSVYDRNGPLNYTNEGVVTLNNSSGSSGTIYLSLTCTETGVKSIGASITTAGETTLPLGSGTVTVQNIFIDEANRYTSKREWEGNRVEVYTKPNADVTLTIPGVAQAVSGKANAAGRAILAYTLPDNAAYGQSYTLTATANGGSAKTSVTYLPANAELQWFGFHYYGYDITVIDNIHPKDENTYYTYFAFANEKSKLFSFSAKFKADQKLNVTAIVTMQDGSVRSVPMTRAGSEGNVQTYVGELYLEGNTDNHIFHADSIPVGFEIDWEEPVAPEPDKNELYNQALKNAIERQQQRYTEWQEFLLDENPTQTGEDEDLEDLTGIFFGYSYRMTDTEAFKESLLTKEKYDEWVIEIEKIEDETKRNTAKDLLDGIYTNEAQYLADAYAAEAAMDEAAAALTDLLQLKHPIQEYSDWNAVLSEMGVEYSEGNTDTAADLEADGYTQMGAFWYKQDENGSFTAVWPDGLNTEPEPAAETQSLNGTPSDVRYAGPNTGVKLSWDSTKKSFDNNWSDQTRWAAGQALDHAAEQLKDLAEKETAKANSLRDLQQRIVNNDANRSFKQRVGKMADAKTASAQINARKAKLTKGLSHTLSIYNLVSDADQLNENIVATAESKAKASELEPLIQYYTKHGDTSGCLDALKKEQAGYESLNTLMELKSKHLVCNIGMNLVATITDVVSAGAGGRVFLAYDVASGALMVSNDILIAELQKAVNNLNAKRQSLCGDWRKIPKRTLTPILDPSGIVYEAVESNVLSGVTATLYEIDEENSSETQWNAGAYDQTNPQETVADGYYAWDVPPGKWKVKFTKAGYKGEGDKEIAETNALTVPPPRMNLKTAMVSTAAPEVVSAAAYPDYVELVFSQYMSVKDEGKPTADGYTCEWVKKEKVSAEDSTEYSKVLHLIPTSKLNVGESVTVTLSGAKNYAGKTLKNDSYSSGPLTVAVEPATLKLNYENQIAVLVGEEKDPRVTVQVLDSSGQPISGLTVTAAIADTAYATISTTDGRTVEDTTVEDTTVASTTDASGVAVFDLKGTLPGWTEATFAVAGSSLTKTMPVRVTIDSNQVAKPVATIGGKEYTESTNSITVPRGSALTLTCATEDAVIYYTTNDTCPCQALDRQRYTDPITVNEDTYFRIAAYKDGMEYSERLNLRVHVTDESYSPTYPPTVIQSEGGNVTVSPKYPTAGSKVTVTPKPDEGYEVDEVIVTDRNGNPVEVTDNGNGTFSFKQPSGKVTITVTFKPEKDPVKDCDKDSTCPASKFTDVKMDWTHDGIHYCVENGLMNGTGDETFEPEGTAARAMLVTVLYRLEGEPEVGECTFSDVPEGEWYTNAVIWAAENGIVEGYDGKFEPTDDITRQEFATILYRYAVYKGYDVSVGEDTNILSFVSVNTTSV